MEQKHKLLEVKDLRVSFFTHAGEVKAVGGISYELDYGEVMGIVGESGSGKSVEAYSIMALRARMCWPSPRSRKRSSGALRSA